MLMFQRNPFSRYKWRFFFATIILILLYNELLCHKVNTLYWKGIKCKKNCTRILLVADPQLIGETFDEHLYNDAAIYDSDNFLHRTFVEAFHHVKPDIIIFLGDIFDEGSVANNDEYLRYLDRFQRIFSFDSKILKIVIPGDNDIGGENGEIVTPLKLNRFKSTFKTRPEYTRNEVVIYNVNRISREVTAAPKPVEDNTKIIAISHFSLLFHHDQFAERVLNTLKPNIIFTGHLHRSLFIKSSKTYSEFTKAIPLNNAIQDRFSVHNFDLSEKDTYLEILVPTCSYRMGELNVGYGMAVIEDNDLFYTVLWSVSRFPQLITYLILLFFVLLTGIISCTYLTRQRCLKRKLFNYSKL